jgi:hypothetical protein
MFVRPGHPTKAYPETDLNRPPRSGFTAVPGRTPGGVAPPVGGVFLTVE